MTTKDTKQKTKTSLMDELKSIKGVLDTDDDNVPLLLDDKLPDDDDIPVLAEEDDGDVPILADDDDVPVLTSSETIANKSSLDAAIRQLESMELSPKAGKVTSGKVESLEEKIRNNAAPPLFEDKATTVRENPFLKKPTDRFSESRKQAEEALQSVIAHSRAAAPPNKPAVFESKQPTATPLMEDHHSDSPIDFTDNPFLKASSAAVPVSTPNKSAAPAAAAKEKEDGADEILKLLDEDSGLDIDLGDDFGDLVDIDVDALIAEKPAPKPPANKQTPPKPAAKPASSQTVTGDKLNQLVDEVIDEYLVVLEAALKKKLKTQINQIVDEVGDEYLVILEAALKKKLQEK